MKNLTQADAFLIGGGHSDRNASNDSLKKLGILTFTTSLTVGALRLIFDAADLNNPMMKFVSNVYYGAALLGAAYTLCTEIGPKN